MKTTNIYIFFLLDEYGKKACYPWRMSCLFQREEYIYKISLSIEYILNVSYMLSQIIFPQTCNMCPSSMLVCTRHAYQSAKDGKYLNCITVTYFYKRSMVIVAWASKTISPFWFWFQKTPTSQFMRRLLTITATFVLQWTATN